MNLKLRPIKSEDLKKVFEWRNDPEVRKNSLTQHIISMNEHNQYWNRFLSNEKNLAYIIVKDNSTDIGVLKLKYQDTGTSEVDIILSKDYRGKGTGKQVLDAAKEKAFKKGIKKLTAKIKHDNIASIKTFEKCGFVPNLVYYELEIK